MPWKTQSTKTHTIRNILNRIYIFYLTETGSITDILPKEKAPGPDDCTGKSYQTYTENYTDYLQSIPDDRNRGNTS